jgi:hypothetical protein
MKYLHQISRITLLIIFAYSFFSFDTEIIDYDYELNRLIREFKIGVTTEEGFEDLYDKFDDLEDDIEDYHDDENTQESKKMLEKAEALTSLIGEISPDGRNFTLTMNRYLLAADLLDLSPYIHPYFEDEGSYCLKIIQFFLWEDNYQSLLIVNDTPNLIRYNASVMSTNNINSNSASTSKSQGGVDCNSIRGIEGYFTTKNGFIQCTGLSCETTPHCINKK